MNQKRNKVMSMSEAVSKFIQDGDTIYLPWGAPGAPAGAVHEVIRQDKRDLTMVGMANSGWVDPLFFGKQVKRIITGWVGSELVGLAQIFRRKVERSEIEIEDYTNFHIGMMLWGGRANVPFIPVPVETGGDMLRKRGFLGEKKYSMVECPFSGKKTVILPTYQPDVGIVHVQRCDKDGNAQTWGTHVDFKSEIHLACKKLIVSAEEIVDDDIITHDPDRTMTPAFKVCAVVQEPWNAHPEAMYGFYDNDLAYRIFYEHSTYDDESTKKWMDEWVFGVSNRQEYIEHYIERFGFSKFMRLKPKPFYSASVNYGRPLSEVY
ncbi:MAG: CoA transferase subunit A [Syntrophobacteraceae bacterium]